MKYFKLHVVLFIAIVFCQNTFAQNPIIKDIGMADPHVRIFNDTIFLYTGHDADPKAKTWTMKDWMIFSTTDLVNWEKRGTISPKDNYMGKDNTSCWASDAETRNGKYYFYFSDSINSIGVMSSNSPSGPFKDAIGKPLVSPMHDPTVFIDDNDSKTPYLIYGHKEGGGYHIVKLNNDMVSLAEAPKPIIINGTEWERTPPWMDKNYLFKHNGVYYLSWGANYAISDNIYGPYECMGKVGSGHQLNVFAHESFFEWKGQFYHTWCYYLETQYKYRETIITYCHFTDDGQIVTDTEFLDKHFAYGVGRYDASWEKIEAEWFYDKSKGSLKTGNKDDGFKISNLTNKSWIKFSNVAFNENFKFISANLSNNSNGKIIVRVNGLDGEKIGEISFNESSDIHNSQQVKSEILSGVSGEKDIYLIFEGGNNMTVSLDWIKFEK